MKNKERKYYINGIGYEQDELYNLALKASADISLESWEKDIYLTIQSWFGTNNYIEIKTSGSTGKPQIISLTKQQMAESAFRTGNFLFLNPGMSSLLCLPASNIAGKMMIIRSFVLGLNLWYVKPEGNPLQNNKMTYDFAALTPFQVNKILESKDNISRIKKIIIGGGQISNVLAEKLKYAKTDCYATYGMTETITHIALQKLSLPDIETSFTTLEKIKIRTDERGCLCITTPYFSEEVITNDIVEILDENHFRFQGRYDNIINSGGIKIIPEDIEKILEEIILQPFYITSEHDNELGEKVIIVIEGEDKSSVHLNDIRNIIETSLSRFHVPKRIVHIKNFSWTNSGKIVREKIKN